METIMQKSPWTASDIRGYALFFGIDSAIRLLETIGKDRFSENYEELMAYLIKRKEDRFYGREED